MTKIQSLKFSIFLWNWLADHPKAYKVDYTHMDVYDWESACALCEYAAVMAVERGKETYNFSCKDCLMLNHWPTPDGKTSYCGIGAYEDWEDAGEPFLGAAAALEYDRSFFALVLVEAFEERLIEVLNGEFKKVVTADRALMVTE